MKFKSVEAFFFENIARQNGLIFQFFKRPFLRNERPYRYARWRVLRYWYGLSKNCHLTTLAIIEPKL